MRLTIPKSKIMKLKKFQCGGVCSDEIIEPVLSNKNTMKTINKIQLKIVLMYEDAVLVELEGDKVFMHKNVLNHLFESNESVPYRIISHKSEHKETNWVEIHAWRRM